MKRGHSPTRRICATSAFVVSMFGSQTAIAQDAGVADPNESSLAEVRAARKQLESNSPDERKRACGALDTLPIAAMEARLTELARDKDDGWDGVVRRLRDLESKKPDDIVDEVALAGEVAAAIETACLLRSAARTRKSDGMFVLVHHASDHRASFRPLITRFLQEAGDIAIASFIRARKEPASDTRRWAWNFLEDSKRRLPGDAVQTKDYAALAEILRAFAELRDQDAIPVIAAFINSDRTVVREAARWALLDYGQGALWKLRETYSNLLGTQAPEPWKAEEVADHLFKALDKIRLDDVYALIDEGLKEGQAGNIDAAIERFDQALAREPLLDRRSETTRYYYEKGKSLRDSNRNSARSLFEKARWIGPPEQEAKLLESELAFLDGLESVERGAPDASRFEAALRLNPANERARKELAALQKMVEPRSSKARRYGMAACLLVAAIAVAFFFGGKTKSRAVAD